MTFKKSIEQFLNTVGEEVRVETEGKSYNVKALIEPMRYKNKLYLEAQLTELGIKDGECLLYLGPAEPDFSGKEINTIIYADDRNYNVSRADRVQIKGDTQYIWAVLTFRIKDGDYDEM